MHAVKRTAERLIADREAYDAVRELTERLSSAGPPAGRDHDRQD
jgi:hypothetical protein